MRRATGPGCRAALIAPMPCADQAELLRAFDLPIALMQDAEALERITAELVETKAADGVRYVEIRWGPLLHVARRAAAGRRDRGGLRAARSDAAAPDRAPSSGSSARRCARTTRRPTSTLAETAARFRDQGLTGWDLAGPEAAFPDPLVHAARVRGRRGRAACGSPSTPASGAARPRSGARSSVDPERIAHGPGAVDDPALCAELIDARRRPSTCARPRTGRPGSCRRVADAPAGPAPPARRPGHAHHRRHDRLGHHAVRGVRQRGRGDRADLPELWAIDRHALDVAFADEADLAPLRAAFAAWGEGVPELAASRHLAGGESLQGRGQLGGVGGDRGRPLVGGQGLDLGPGRDAGQHEHAARPDGPGRGEVRARSRRRS